MDDLGVPLFLETPICTNAWKSSKSTIHLVKKIIATDFPQKVANTEGTWDPLFQRNPGWWNIQFGQIYYGWIVEISILNILNPTTSNKNWRMDIQNSHVWKDLGLSKLSFFGIHVKFPGSSSSKIHFEVNLVIWYPLQITINGNSYITTNGPMFCLPYFIKVSMIPYVTWV